MQALDIIAGASAFGDANHPTTRLLLHALDVLAPQMQPERICDMGCGSGILSLRAAQLWPDAQIIAADIERSATEATEQNAKANGCAHRIHVLHSDGFNHPAIDAAAPYDLIVMNILAEPILRLLGDAAPRMAQGGVMLLSGLLQWQEEQIIQANQSLEIELTHRLKEGDWVAHLWQKP